MCYDMYRAMVFYDRIRVREIVCYEHDSVSAGAMCFMIR